jgi:hypothetical protein
MVTDLRSFEITSARGERMRASGRLGQRARFDIVLRPGWCVMRSRFAFLGGLRLPGMRLLDPVLRLLEGRPQRPAGGALLTS